MSSNLPYSSPADSDLTSDRFGHLIGNVFRQWRRYVDEQFKDVGFTDATRTPIIALFDHKGAMRQKELASKLGLDPSSLVRVLEILRKRDLITWESDPEDKRAKRITLTAEGQKWAALIIQKSLEIERHFLAEITAHELQTARSVLKKVATKIPEP